MAYGNIGIYDARSHNHHHVTMWWLFLITDHAAAISNNLNWDYHSIIVIGPKPFKVYSRRIKGKNGKDLESDRACELSQLEIWERGWVYEEQEGMLDGILEIAGFFSF